MKLQMSASQFAERIGKIDTIEHTASEKVGEAPADGNEYVRKDGTWTKPDKYSKAEADETFLKKTETPTLDNVYTKVEIDKKLADLGSDVTSESVAQQISAALVNYVEKVTGKDLSSNDFTTELKEKLEGLSNYDDTAVQESLTQLSNRLDTLVGTSASEAIDTFNEIEAFLQGITDTKTLTGLLAELKAEVVAAIPTNVSQLTNDAGFISNETDPTVPDWAKQPEKPTYTAEEVGALSSVPQASDTVLGGVKIGYVQNEKNYPVELDAEGKAFVSVPWNGEGGGSGSLNETINIALVSNQDEVGIPNSDLLNKAIHVLYGELDVEVMWTGETIQMAIPAYATYQVVFPIDDRYKCPETQEYTAVPGSIRSINGYYYTEIVSVNVSADDSESMAGQVVTINGVKYTYESETVSAKIPYGTNYTVSVSKKDGYRRPEDIVVVASQKTRDLSFVFKYITIDVIVIDQTITDPATMISGDVNGEIIQWIRNNSHRVLGKKTAEGEMTYCRLDDTDSNKFYDGSFAPLTGTEGDVFMKMPEFYYKGTEGDIVNLMFAKERFDDECVRWDPNTLIGVYKSYVERSLLYSKSGVRNTSTPFSIVDYQNYASGRGKGYQIVDWQMHCIMGCLFYAMYGTTQNRETIGYGTRMDNTLNGQTDALGMTDTKYNADDIYANVVNFWGLEEWWGDGYEFTQGLTFPRQSRVGFADDPVNGGLRTVTAQSYGSGSSSAAYKMLFGKYCDLIAVTGGAGTNTGFCDYQRWYTTVSSSSGTDSNTEYLLYRSGYSTSTGCGISTVYTIGNSYTPSSSYNGYRSRLAFRGISIEETNIEKFKAIVITN